MVHCSDEKRTIAGGLQRSHARRESQIEDWALWIIVDGKGSWGEERV